MFWQKMTSGLCWEFAESHYLFTWWTEKRLETDRYDGCTSQYFQACHSWWRVLHPARTTKQYKIFHYPKNHAAALLSPIVNVTWTYQTCSKDCEVPSIHKLLVPFYWCRKVVLGIQINNVQCIQCVKTHHLQPMKITTWSLPHTTKKIIWNLAIHAMSWHWKP